MHPREHRHARNQHEHELAQVPRAEALLAHVNVVKALGEVLVHSGGIGRNHGGAAVLVKREAVHALVFVVVDYVVLQALPVAVFGGVDPHPGLAFVALGRGVGVGVAVLALVVAV